MNLSASKRAGLRRIAILVAFAAYVGVTACLHQNETRMHAMGEVLARRHHAIESELLGVRTSLDRLAKASNPPAILVTRLREKQDEVIEERRESTREYETWKAQSGAWRIKRWFVLAIATLAFLPVVVWGFQSWSIWARDKRLNRSQGD
jgi:hypothetical protein